MAILTANQEESDLVTAFRAFKKAGFSINDGDKCNLVVEGTNENAANLHQVGSTKVKIRLNIWEFFYYGEARE